MTPRRHAYTMFVMATGAALGVAATLATQTTLRPGGPAMIANPSAEAALDRPVADVNLVDVPLADAVDRLGKAAGVPVVLDEPPLRMIGVARDRPVSLRGRNVPLGVLLNQLVHAAQDTEAGELPVWTVDGGQIVLSRASADRGRAAFVRVYDVRDVLAILGEPWQPEPPQQQPSQTTTTRQEVRCFQPDAVSDLLKLIQDVVYPDTWREAGGSDGTIRYSSGRLIVTQSHNGHRELRKMLANLRSPPPGPRPEDPPASRWHDGLGRWVPLDEKVADAKLRAPLAEFRADEPVGDALARWAAAAGVDVYVDPTAAQVGRLDRPVTLTRRSAPAGDVLSAVLAGGPSATGDVPPRLSWWYDGGVVVVGMRADAERHPVTRVYDLRGWLESIGRAPGEKALDRLSNARSEAVDGLIRRLVETVDRPSWMDAGGAVGNAFEVCDQLVVRQLPENVAAVERFVYDVRRANRVP